MNGWKNNNMGQFLIQKSEVITSNHRMVNACFQVSTFFIEAVDLGDVQKVVVEKTPGVQWHLSQITVKKGAFAPKEDVFYYDRFVARHLSVAYDDNK